VRDAAATSPECGGARRELAGATPDRAVGHLFVRKRALHEAEQHAHTPSGSGDGAGTHGGRRRKGADQPLRRARGAAKARKKKENRARKFCSPREETLGELTGEGEAAVKEFDGDGGSGGAPAGGDPSSRRCTTPVAASPGQQASREGYDRVRGRKG
jgi:hypothetical protein